MTAARKSSASAVMFHGAVAQRFGLTATDSKTIDILSREGPLTAGEIATRTGLQATSVTSLIDRLEDKQMVRRVRDPADRRRVIVELVPGVAARLGAVYDVLRADMESELERYSDDELALITTFLSRSADAMLAAIAKLEAAPATTKRGRA